MSDFDLNALDSLLSGNTTTATPPVTETIEDVTPTTEDPTTIDEGTDDIDGGGQDNLESSKDEPEDDDGNKSKATQNAAFARLRTENKQLAATVQQIAQALGIKDKDPSKMGEALVQMAQAKLAKDNNLPVEVYRELTSTKEQLAELQMQQNTISARDKFTALKAEFELDDKQLIKFAGQLDAEGINIIQNPNVDLSYEYYRRNRKELEEKRIAKAVEDALKKSSTADAKSSTPSKQQGKSTDTTPAKVNNISALNGLLDGK